MELHLSDSPRDCVFDKPYIDKILESLPKDLDKPHLSLMIYTLLIKTLQKEMRKTLKTKLAELGYPIVIGRPRKNGNYCRKLSEETREKDRIRARERYHERKKKLSPCLP